MRLAPEPASFGLLRREEAVLVPSDFEEVDHSLFPGAHGHA
jgi:hypothetical protein